MMMGKVTQVACFDLAPRSCRTASRDRDQGCFSPSSSSGVIMQQYKPHPGATFEGHYSKFKLPSGAHLALVICSVPGASERPHMVSFSYVPKDTSELYQKELFVQRLDMVPFDEGKDGNSVAFEQRFDGGKVVCRQDSTTEYDIETDDFTFHAKTTSRVPYDKDTETPEGLLVYLPLPLHWHVHSLSSRVDFTLAIKDYPNLPEEDKSGSALVHLEKNWGHSFPSAHIWLQARDGDRGICIAGGQILGLEAYLVGYSSSKPEFTSTYRPPLAVKLAGLSPTMRVASNWEDRTFELSVQSWRRKLVVKAKAPIGSYFGLSAPFRDGHRENFLGQSFEADVTVEVYEAGWFSAWRKVHEESFERASLEFGAAYYPPAGTQSRRH